MNINVAPINNDLRGIKANTIDVFAQVVGSTLGPCGRYVMIRKERVAKVTKDGVTVANSIESSDPIEQAIIEVIREAARATVEVAGDGTTSTTILAASIFKRLGQVIPPTANVIQIQNDLEQFNEKMFAWIKEHQVMSVTPERIHQVAMTSTNGDEKIASTISDVFAKVGGQGVVDVNISNTENDRVEISYGMRLETGFGHPAFVNVPSKQCYEGEGVRVYCVEADIRTREQFADLLRNVIDAKYAGLTSALVIVENIDDELLGAHAFRLARETIVIKAPDFGIRRKYSLADIAAYCGTKVISGADLEKKDLGFDAGSFLCNVQCHRGYTVIQNTDGGSFSSHVESLEKYKANLQSSLTIMEESGNDYDANVLTQRIARLNSAIAKVFVGGETDVDAKERKDRFEDAICAVRTAMKGGVVAGGGAVLPRAAHRVAYELLENCTDQGVRDLIDAYVTALHGVFKTLLTNSGREYFTDTIGQLMGEESLNCAIDPISGNIVDMVEKGVLDPYGVIEASVKNATSVALTLLFMDHAVFEI